MASPRKDPLRASRIFVLASQSTLSELRQPARDFEHQRDRAGRLLINALECLLLAQAERVVSAQMYAEARQQHAPLPTSSAYARLSFELGRQLPAAPHAMAELVLAINTLTEALDTVRDGNQVELARYAVVLGQVARNLGSQESN